MSELNLSEAIGQLRREIGASMQAAGNEPLQFQLGAVELELQVQLAAKAGVKMAGCPLRELDSLPRQGRAAPAPGSSHRRGRNLPAIASARQRDIDATPVSSCRMPAPGAPGAGIGGVA